MSSKKKNKNRIRRSTKLIYSVVAIIILLTSFYTLIKETQDENIDTKNKQVYSYTNSYNYDYNVNLIKNKYMSNVNKDKDKGLVYVTDLIDTIDLTLNYKYSADKSTDLKGNYSVIGRLQVIYTRDGEEQRIWQDDETLVENKKIEEVANSYKINEKLNLDLKDKNDMLRDFKQEMGMTVSATYSVILQVNLNTEVEGEQVNVSYAPVVQIELANKTTKILGDNNLEETQYVSKKYQQSRARNKFKVVLSVLGIIIAFAIVKYLSKFRIANVVKNEYRQELNRILKLCQDKIVQVSNRPVAKDEEIVVVKDFGEIFKVSEELFKPILYYYDVESEEAWFCVMTGSVVYKYILKR